MNTSDSSPSSEDQPEKLVSVYNRGTNIYTHGNLKLLPKTFLDVTESVAAILTSCKEYGQAAVVLATEMKGASSVAPADPAVAKALEAQIGITSELQKSLDEKDAELAGLKKLLENLTAPPATATVKVASPAGT